MAGGSNHTASGKLKVSALLAFAAAGLPVGALSTPLVVYLPKYFASYAGLSLGAVSAIFALVKILDLIFDPVMGMVMDRTRTPIGRYRFWMVVSTPLLLIGVYMLFMAKPGVSTTYLTGWLIAFYIGFSLFVLSQSAWGAVVARGYGERSNVFAAAQVMGAIGAVAVLAVPPALKLGFGGTVNVMGIMILVAIPICIFLTSVFVREPVLPPRAHGEHINWREIPALITHRSMSRLLATDLLLTLGPGFTAPLYFFFFQQARGYSTTETSLLLLVYVLASILVSPIWAAVANRLQKHRTLLLAALLYSLAQAMIAFIPSHNIPLMAPGMFIAGGIASAFGFLIRAMVADVADEVRLETGKERAGLLYAFITSTVKIGTASSVSTLALLGLFGFNPLPGAHNTPQAIQALVMIYAFLPVVAVALGGLVMLTYRLDKTRHAEIRAELDKRDAAAGMHLDPPVPPISAIEAT